MTLPDNIDLRWIATRLVELQNDVRAIKADIELGKHDRVVIEALLRRLDSKQNTVIDEVRALIALERAP